MKNHTVSTIAGGSINLIAEPQGVMFLYVSSDSKSQVADMFSVGVSKSSVNRLLQCLKDNQTFIISDKSLRIWKDGEVVKIHFFSDGITAACDISIAEADKMTNFLSGGR